MTTHLQPTLADYAAKAADCLAPDVKAYFLAGAGNEKTLAANSAAFDQVSVIPRHLCDLRSGSAAVEVASLRMSHPIIIAPFAYQTLLCPDGEVATAQAAAAQGTLMTLSAQSACDMRMVRQAGASCLWFQLYWLGTREATLGLCQRAADAGFQAIVLTVDAPVHGVRDSEIRAGFVLPEGTRAVNLEGVEPPKFAPLDDGESAIFDRIAHVAPRWEDVAWLIEASPLPVMIKGILHPDDAKQAQQIGATGVIVSNHGGRVLDAAIASLRALPAVRAAVGAEFTVLMDGGVRRGIDVFKAMALGADAVMVGRPVIHGLAVAGAAGASHVLRLLQDEFEIAMMLAGCRTCADITPEKVHLNW
ncbi:alpha-hydroxy acid oxidase [Donghicola sp. XS_ASV15]|uniref:alpha-hydroxy acid oxidase n=1 Tax=Donghicola sp. XS_ASV15 TaxID=3241295 RepID=UPI0035167681